MIDLRPVLALCGCLIFAHVDRAGQCDNVLARAGTQNRIGARKLNRLLDAFLHREMLGTIAGLKPVSWLTLKWIPYNQAQSVQILSQGLKEEFPRREFEIVILPIPPEGRFAWENDLGIADVYFVNCSAVWALLKSAVDKNLLALQRQSNFAVEQYQKLRRRRSPLWILRHRELLQTFD